MSIDCFTDPSIVIIYLSYIAKRAIHIISTYLNRRRTPGLCIWTMHVATLLIIHTRSYKVIQQED